eukprot:5230549-Pleurochrysis_carterae.AAC.3
MAHALHLSLPVDSDRVLSRNALATYLARAQAMADFAYLIAYLREERGASESAFIGFGGSYGGMLAAWFRVHYPNAIAGAVAASAPIWSFPRLSPPYDDNAFNKAVTLDASAAGGASDACKDGLKAAWPRILAAAKTDKGRRLLGEAFRTCAPVRPRSAHADDAYSIVQARAAGRSCQKHARFLRSTNGGFALLGRAC